MTASNWEKHYNALGKAVDRLASVLDGVRPCKCKLADCPHVAAAIHACTLGKAFERILREGLVKGYTK